MPQIMETRKRSSGLEVTESELKKLRTRSDNEIEEFNLNRDSKIRVELHKALLNRRLQLIKLNCKSCQLDDEIFKIEQDLLFLGVDEEDPDVLTELHGNWIKTRCKEESSFLKDVKKKESRGHPPCDVDCCDSDSDFDPCSCHCHHEDTDSHDHDDDDSDEDGTSEDETRFNRLVEGYLTNRLFQLIQKYKMQYVMKDKRVELQQHC